MASLDNLTERFNNLEDDLVLTKGSDMIVQTAMPVRTSLCSRSQLTKSSMTSLEEKAEDITVEEVSESNGPTALPLKRGSKLTRYLRHNFFSTYRKSFAIIFFVNISIMLWLLIANDGIPKSRDVGTAASANLMVAMLFRQEDFVNLFYEILLAAPLSWPLFIRKRLAKVFHYGGCHSGCGVASAFWVFLYTGLVTWEYVCEPKGDILASTITSWLLVVLLLMIMGGAYPSFRAKYHDSFELFHRFAGWTALITFWINTGFSCAVLARQTDSSIGLKMVTSMNFWGILVSTACVLITWSRLHLREVFPEKLSEHAIRLHFRYHAMKPFYGIRLSTEPLTEWHAFATIPDIDAATGKIDGFSVVVSNAGDWTQKQIECPSQKLWVRGYPLRNLLYSSVLFKRVIVVATGSGIGPCLSLLVADLTPRRVLWSTPNPETTYNQAIIDTVRRADPEAVIWNSRTQGRPDLVKITYDLVRDFEAEAVFVISNPNVTRKVVYAMQTRGIAAYGAIFDS